MITAESESQSNPLRHKEDVSGKQMGPLQADPRRLVIQRHAGPHEVQLFSAEFSKSS